MGWTLALFSFEPIVPARRVSVKHGAGGPDNPPGPPWRAQIFFTFAQIPGKLNQTGPPVPSPALVFLDVCEFPP
jgi:hypothetical protein